MNKVEAAKDFLKSLENPQITMDIMVDRIDVQMLYVINNYADLISKVKKKTKAGQSILFFLTLQHKVLFCKQIILIKK